MSASPVGRLPLRVAAWALSLVIVAALGASVALAYARSTALTDVTVTAVDAAAEPRDHLLPFVRQQEALPDYEVRLRGHGLFNTRSLGVKRDRSAADGLRWAVEPPVALTEIAAVDLRDRDAALSDALASVPATPAGATEGNYRFAFETNRSWQAGTDAFFATAVGKALTAGLTIAVVLLILTVLCL